MPGNKNYQVVLLQFLESKPHTLHSLQTSIGICSVIFLQIHFMRMYTSMELDHADIIIGNIL